MVCVCDYVLQLYRYYEDYSWLQGHIKQFMVKKVLSISFSVFFFYFW